jgi:hypothetical protein
MIAEDGNSHDSRRIEELKHLIDDREYLSDAIRRIAQVLGDELLGVTKAGALHERER